jgi:alcohol dehydrogenase class IV
MASPQRYARIAQALGLTAAGLSAYEAGDRLVRHLKFLLEFLHVSPRLGSYGISEAAIPRLVEGATKQSRLFVPNPRNLTKEDIAAIYKEAI